jgi:hypothetical protein
VNLLSKLVQSGEVSRRADAVFMFGLNRVIRPGFYFSVVAHLGLLLGLFFVGAGGIRSVPPEAMTVEIVPSDEAPQVEAKQVEGTPLDSTSSGSEVSSNSEKGSAAPEPPRPKRAAPSLQQAHTDLNSQHPNSLTAAQPQTETPEQDETTPEFRPLLPAATNDAANQPKVNEMFAMPLALPGGRLGGGFDTPSNNPAMLPHDDTAAFRARLSSCSYLPPGIDENIAIELRISFKPDGTLASPPQLLNASLSPDAVALMRSAVNALQRCQPFTELPVDKYGRWKRLDLVVTPIALSGGRRP